jgi:hypothetical protein
LKELSDRDGTVPTPLPEPHGSMLAFLLHEQIEIQMIACTDDSLREVLADLKSKVENAGLIVTLLAGLKR